VQEISDCGSNTGDAKAGTVKTCTRGASWSQDALALEAGLDRTFIAHVETLRRNISLDNVERLALALDVRVAELFAE
jgi:transcriptional regulator with XRE-family HTH domain